MQLITILGLAAAVAVAKPTVYFIRHGEKPADDGNGLSAQGLQRAQCLRSVFGASSDYDIGYILAQTPKSSTYKGYTRSWGTPSHGKRQRPLDTVKPLAADLGLSVDTHCDRDDPKCVKKAVQNYKGDGNILICWEHKALTDLAEKLGAGNVEDYPSDHFDLIWVDEYPYSKINDIETENCPGI
ncbi:phosphoglycerate mutase family protein, putative [Beauveria bassiana ARSEF 2860]|uniref:Phosphoglycerate mutase family protein, putative n=1 Tax=Beauveria bassiana (strain ARSEF 2860) TaxID=655819 RepID=J4KPR3_BEAB2|nr:phosphoglycerate mutase family protein, putative [Beauveria bassiana ARSEF 2860]EJP67904.1 phosphoglycerate mutase family protein, putative [Beauveria bassiana ARSEF 2860]